MFTLVYALQIINKKSDSYI